MNIGELARAAVTKPETIRYYERIGLLPPPPRTAGNYRDYSAEDARRLVFTRRARHLGFSIEQIRALLNLADHKEQSCEAVDVIAREHLAEVKRKLASLTALRRELERLIGQCRHGTIAECRILEALAPAGVSQKRSINETITISSLALGSVEAKYRLDCYG
jgi:Cu(I)-responsive transcriptional regulator